MRRRLLELSAFLGALALLAPNARAQQEAVLTGHVTGEGGAPLPNASVFIEQTREGTLTGTDGAYRLVVPAARATGQQVTLSVRLIGYRQASDTLALTPGSHTHDFTLVANPLRLGEIVVTGQGLTTTREKLGNVINTVDSSAIARSNESNVVNAIAAKAPNVEVTSQAGDPGASSYIRIRGPKTISGTGQPLFVVDGVPIDNSTLNTEGSTTQGTVSPNRASDINPDNIASIDILKGAAAAAIYGARAGQGVVLITTKKGQSGPTRYTLSSSYSFDDVTNGIPLQTKFGLGGLNDQGVPERPDCNNLNPSAGLDCYAGTTTSFGPELPAGTPTYDHWNEIFDTGHTWDNNLSISGGNDRTLFFLAGGRTTTNGTMVGPNNKYDKTSARLNASHRVFDNLNVGLNISYVDTRGKYIQMGSNIDGLLLGSLRTPPEFNNQEFLDPTSKMHRSYRFPFPSVASATMTRGYDNPFFVLNEDENNSKLARTFGNVNISYDPFDWLNLKETFGADYYTDQRLEGFPLTSSGQPTGMVFRTDFTNYQLDQNLIATASHTFNPSFAGSLTIGQNINARNFQQVRVQGITLVAPQPFNLLNTINWTPNDFQSQVHSESYFAQATADLFDRLHLTAAVRNDGFSTFGSSSRRHWFPKASAAFTLIDNTEGSPGFLSFAKLRAAYGETGTEPPVYSTDQVYLVGQFISDAGWGSQLFENQGGNGGVLQGTTKAQPNLGPERTKEVEVGTDLGFFGARGDASITLYNDRTEGAIFLAPLANSTGFVNQAQNAGTIRNRGVEVALNVRPIMNPDLTWEVGLQWARNQNQVLDLSGQQFVDLPTGGYFTGAIATAWKGSGLGVIRGADFARCGLGLVIDGVNIDQACGSAPKGALFIGQDGFPVVDPTNRVIADGNPKWTGAVRTSLTWRKIQVTGLLDIRHGGQTWNGTRGALTTFGTSAFTEDRNVQRTFGKDFMPGAVGGPGAGTPVTIDENWYAGNGGGFGPVAAQFIEDASFVKLREVSLAYTFDQPWVTKTLGLSSVDLRLSGRNLHTWTDYTGIDPESNLGGAAVLIQGIDYFNNPQTRSFVISLGLNR
ncbi:MAG TPA: SusC/RagA family TonB-linked outer membrane protein [Gemmatimonadaceae bacterium]|jgi:TonB-linked SusC/RagA family outer membrane protein|nr:SusC/RagA family TonB-linked outer membrane protein [Gemmatimonadaceae bacterium]